MADTLIRLATSEAVEDHQLQIFFFAAESAAPGSTDRTTRWTPGAARSMHWPSATVLLCDMEPYPLELLTVMTLGKRAGSYGFGNCYVGDEKVDLLLWKEVFGSAIYPAVELHYQLCCSSVLANWAPGQVGGGSLVADRRKGHGGGATNSSGTHGRAGEGQASGEAHEAAGATSRNPRDSACRGSTCCGVKPRKTPCSCTGESGESRDREGTACGAGCACACSGARDRHA